MESEGIKKIFKKHFFFLLFLAKDISPKGKIFAKLYKATLFSYIFKKKYKRS